MLLFGSYYYSVQITATQPSNEIQTMDPRWNTHANCLSSFYRVRVKSKWSKLSRFKFGRIVESPKIMCDVTSRVSAAQAQAPNNLAYIEYLVLSYEPLCPLQRSWPHCQHLWFQPASLPHHACSGIQQPRSASPSRARALSKQSNLIRLLVYLTNHNVL